MEKKQYAYKILYKVILLKIIFGFVIFSENSFLNKKNITRQ